VAISLAIGQIRLTVRAMEKQTPEQIEAEIVGAVQRFILANPSCDSAEIIASLAKDGMSLNIQGLDFVLKRHPLVFRRVWRFAWALA
jgi:hypothetical protein